jgi:hypothetical protein
LEDFLIWFGLDDDLLWRWLLSLVDNAWIWVFSRLSRYDIFTLNFLWFFNGDLAFLAVWRRDLGFLFFWGREELFGFDVILKMFFSIFTNFVFV